MKVGTVPRERLSGTSSRRWLPELLALTPAPSSCDCRVCGKPIAEAEASWGWRWKSTARGHLQCGWWRLDDVDGMSALRGLGDLRTPPTRQARERAHELFIMQCVTSQEHDRGGALREVKTWSLSAVGIALLRLVRAKEAQAAE